MTTALIIYSDIRITNPCFIYYPVWHLNDIGISQKKKYLKFWSNFFYCCYSLSMQKYFLLRVPFLEFQRRAKFLKEKNLFISPVENILLHHFSSSQRRCSVKKGVLKSFANFTEKRPVLESLFDKGAGLQAYRTNFYNVIWSFVFATSDRRASSCVWIAHISHQKVDWSSHLEWSQIFYINFLNTPWSAKHTVLNI